MQGGVLDLDAAARVVLQDWTSGKIPYLSLPPVRNGTTSYPLGGIKPIPNTFWLCSSYQCGGCARLESGL